MTLEQKQAHERMLNSLPVRYHGEPLPLHKTSKKGGRSGRTAAQCKALRERIRYLRKKKSWPVVRIAEYMKTTTATIYNYLRENR